MTISTANNAEHKLLKKNLNFRQKFLILTFLSLVVFLAFISLHRNKIYSNNQNLIAIKEGDLKTVKSNPTILKNVPSNSDITKKSNSALTAEDLSNALISEVKSNPQCPGYLLERVRKHVIYLSLVSHESAISFSLQLPQGVARNTCLAELSKKLKIYPDDDEIISLLAKVSDKEEISAIWSGLFFQLKKDFTNLHENAESIITEWYQEKAKENGQLEHFYWHLSPLIFNQGFDRGLNWLHTLDDTVSSEADYRVVRDTLIYNKRPDLAIKILQSFIDEDKFKRFDAVSLKFVDAYRMSNATECMQWVWELPDDILHKNEMINITLSQLYIKNPLKAEEYLRAISDTKLHELIAKNNAKAREKNGFK